MKKIGTVYIDNDDVDIAFLTMRIGVQKKHTEDGQMYEMTFVPNQENNSDDRKFIFTCSADET